MSRFSVCVTFWLLVVSWVMVDLVTAVVGVNSVLMMWGRVGVMLFCMVVSSAVSSAVISIECRVRLRVILVMLRMRFWWRVCMVVS